VSIYPAKITAIIAKKSRGSIINNGDGRAVSFECGSMVNIRLRIDTATKNIAEMAFSSNGCGYMVAAAQCLADEFRGRNLKDLHGAETDEIASVIERRTGELPASRRQCLDTAIEAFRNAVADHRERIVEEFRGEVTLICTCFGVSEDAINDVIRETQAADPGDVARVCNAGNGCGSCRMLIQELIDMRHVE
jgi:bacterioferritin-associated ferredoxin/NifU-like protein involved in Fe-S cluster formation